MTLTFTDKYIAEQLVVSLELSTEKEHQVVCSTLRCLINDEDAYNRICTIARTMMEEKKNHK